MSEVGLGDRFNHVLEKVRAVVNASNDRIRMLKDLMKTALLTYVQKTHDTQTGRLIFHKAIMAGSDTMLTVTAATMLANVLADSHGDQAQALLQGVAAKLSGKREMGSEIWENASGGAVSTGAIAITSGGKKKKRQDSIFAESVRWDDLQGRPDIMEQLAEIINLAENKVISDILIDPTTAELLLATHGAMTPSNQRRFEAKPLSEMIQIAHRSVQRGLIRVVLENG